MSVTTTSAIRDPLADERDWARSETVDGLRQIVLVERLLQE
jgi:hypothetical protein